MPGYMMKRENPMEGELGMDRRSFERRAMTDLSALTDLSQFYK